MSSRASRCTPRPASEGRLSRAVPAGRPRPRHPRVTAACRSSFTGPLDVRYRPGPQVGDHDVQSDRLRPFIADLRVTGQPGPDAPRAGRAPSGTRSLSRAHRSSRVVEAHHHACRRAFGPRRAGDAWRFRAWSVRAAPTARYRVQESEGGVSAGAFDRRAGPTASAGDAATGFAAKSSSGVPRVRSGVVSPVSLAKSARRGRRRSAQGGQVSDGRGERSGTLAMTDAARRDRRTRSVGSRACAASRDRVGPAGSSDTGVPECTG